MVWKTARTVIPLLQCATALGAAEALPFVELEPFLVRASPWRDQAPSRTLPGETWRDLGAAGLSEALERMEPGISLVRRGGVSNDVVLRGIGGEDLNVTLDGRKIHCACSNRMDPPLSHATAENADRVEIAAGPFSLKRPGSLGGHVNIVASPIPEGTHGRFKSGLQSYAGRRHSFTLSHTEGVLAFRTEGGFQRSDPYETGDGRRVTELPTGSAAYLPEWLDGPAYEAWHAGGELAWALSEGATLRFDLVRREDEEVLYPGLKMDADSTDTTQVGLRLDHEAATGLFENWVADLHFNDTDHWMSDDRRASSRTGPGGVPRPAFVLDRGYFMRTDADARNWGLNFDGEIDTEGYGMWSVGGEYTGRQWESRNVILNIDNAMLPDVLATGAGVYAQAKLRFEGPWSAEAGVRMDRFAAKARGDTGFLESVRGSAPDYEASEPSAFVSLRYRRSENTAFFAGAGSAVRPPSPQELYIQVDKPGANPDWIGNPGLGAPRSTELTAGVERWGDDFEFRLRVFHDWLSDYIYPVAEGGAQSYANIDARLYGVEINAAHRIDAHWRLESGLAWQRGRKRDATGGDRDLAEIPPLRARMALAYESESTRLELEGRVSDEQNRIDSSLNERDLGGWATLSAYARHRLNERWTLFASVENIFDADYALHNAQVRNPFSAFTVVNEPGRMLKAAVEYAF